MTRFRRGHVSAAKLTPTQVQEIRAKWNEGRTQASIAREYQMSEVQIGRICRGVSWQRYAQDPHPDEIEHSKAILPEAPIEPFSPELIEKLSKTLPDVGSETPSVDPIDAYLKRSKEEGSK